MASTNRSVWALSLEGDLINLDHVNRIRRSHAWVTHPDTGEPVYEIVAVMGPPDGERTAVLGLRVGERRAVDELARLGRVLCTGLPGTDPGPLQVRTDQVLVDRWLAHAEAF